MTKEVVRASSFDILWSLVIREFDVSQMRAADEREPGAGLRLARFRRALTDLFLMAIIMVIMARRQAYTLAFAAEVTKHLRAIDTKYRALIREKISKQLRFEPATETTNRKPLRQPAPFGATWEIRFGPDNRFRVLYDIAQQDRVVQIMAIGEKQKERLFIGGEEVQL
jgi:mRNA-degrading endonuclease RelE of RelBE toxin-antitoxin system